MGGFVVGPAVGPEVGPGSPPEQRLFPLKLTETTVGKFPLKLIKKATLRLSPGFRSPSQALLVSFQVFPLPETSATAEARDETELSNESSTVHDVIAS